MCISLPAHTNNSTKRHYPLWDNLSQNPQRLFVSSALLQLSYGLLLLFWETARLPLESLTTHNTALATETLLSSALFALIGITLKRYPQQLDREPFRYPFYAGLFWLLFSAWCALLLSSLWGESLRMVALLLIGSGYLLLSHRLSRLYYWSASQSKQAALSLKLLLHILFAALIGQQLFSIA